ncbi:MAG: hypothetical protein SFV15_23505 [Polyangiaceae bacterium]|nr:hypothetical protein [Polyangiaceae bacterium]
MRKQYLIPSLALSAAVAASMSASAQSTGPSGGTPTSARVLIADLQQSNPSAPVHVILNTNTPMYFCNAWVSDFGLGPFGPYRDWLIMLHKAKRYQTYLEIGVMKGAVGGCQVQFITERADGT